MSALSQSAGDYLALRHALGYKLVEAGRLLPRFVAYLDAAGIPTVTVESALAWSIQASPGTTMASLRMMIVRGFARHMAGIDPATEIPPLRLLPSGQHWRPPFIYSPADIDVLMRQSRLCLHPPLLGQTFETLIGLLTVTGMRIGEVIALDRADVDLTVGVVLVRESKFTKSRYVPLHESTTGVLRGYADHRARQHPQPVSASFLLAATGKRLNHTLVERTFRSLCENAGIGVGAAHPPRLHDLRHTFAVATLVHWYRTGQDVTAKLPMLSTYLGHRDPRSTYWYLSAAPELLALAAGRVEPAAGEVAP